MMDAVLAEVAAERRRQIEVEGFDHRHDDRHTEHELIRAGASYAILAAAEGGTFFQLARSMREVVRWLWPWEAHWLKPKHQRRSLIVAIALLVAAVERIDGQRSDDAVTPDDLGEVR